MKITRHFAAAIVAVGAASVARTAAAQQPASLLQLEVTDTVGIPLPDARLEVFTLLEGGIVWEWARVLPTGLPSGTHLLRISNPGYESAVFSVPLRKDGHVSLRVRLTAETDTLALKEPQALKVRAQGFAIDGRVQTDVIGNRRVLNHRSATMTQPQTLGDLLRHVRGTTLTMYPTSGGMFTPSKTRPLRAPRASRMTSTCSPPVMLNGDRRKVLTFEAANQLLPPEEIEALEIFESPGLIPSPYTVSGGDFCGGSMLVAWMRT
jgi:hypothetical protein